MTAAHAGPDMPTISHPNSDRMTAGTLSYAAAPMQAEEPPPPAHSAHYGPHDGFFVTGCLNCRFCGDAGHPHKPERWMCARTMMECHEARNKPDACGYGARLYKDAISGR